MPMPKGHHHTEETKRKISLTQRKRYARMTEAEKHRKSEHKKAINKARKLAYDILSNMIKEAERRKKEKINP